MKKHFSLLIAFLVTHFASGQIKETNEPFLVIKFTPTSLFNPNTASLLTGVEIWPLKRFNFQFEYGHQFTLFTYKPWGIDKKDWFFRRYKFGMRLHYYRDFTGHRLWHKKQRRLFPTNRRGFIGFDLIAIPQSYVDSNDEVLLKNGSAFSYTTAKIYKNALAATAVFGSQVPLGKKFLTEFYIGLGIKWMNVEFELDMAQATPISVASFRRATDFSSDNEEGLVIMPYIDLGIKIGFEMLHK